MSGRIAALLARPVLSLALAFAGAAFALGCSSSIDSRLDEVRTMQDAGQFMESIEPLRSILAEAPDLPEANHRLGVALMQTGQPSLAVWPLEKSAKSEEFAVSSGLILASAFLGINAPEDAVRVSSHVLEIDPERSAALRMRAHAQIQAGKKEEALVDARRLRQMQPDDYPSAVLLAGILSDLGELDEAEKTYLEVKELGAKSGDPSTAARGCLALANFYDGGRKDRARAEAAFQECVAAYPTEPLALQLATQFYDASGRSDEGTALWKHAVAEAPENLSFRVVLAERMAATGKVDEAQVILVEAAESFGTPGAWQVLSDFQRRRGRGEDAAASLERAIQLAGGGDDTLRFAQGDLYVELGRIEKAEEVLAAISEPTYKDLLRGRILFVKGDPKGALEAFDAGIRRWPNNAVARYLAGIAARDSGESDRAIVELRESSRADAAASDAPLALASILLERGDYQNAAVFAAMHLEKRDPSSIAAFRINSRAAIAAKEYDAARKTLENLRRVPGSEMAYAVERAAIERAAKGPAASVVILEAAKVDVSAPANEELLRALVEDQLALGRGDAAIARVDAALAANAESPTLLELRAATLARAGRMDEARAAFERAMAADPKSAAPLRGLATLEAQDKNVDRALSLLDQAAGLDPKDGASRYLAAQLVLAQGRTDDAEKRLREVIRVSPGNGPARNDLAWILASRGQELDTALSLAEQARRITPTADVIDTLGYVQLKRGDSRAAVALFEEALALRPKDPTIRYHLGLALAQSGNRERAVTTLREAIDSGPFPEAEAAAQEIARLQQPQG